jgi:hypothetical protein
MPSALVRESDAFFLLEFLENVKTEKKVLNFTTTPSINIGDAEI